jgi:hypothetical protein
MARQEFAAIIAGDLLGQVERIVIDSHRRLYEEQGREWSRPLAYRWLRYEDPMPVARLQEGVRKLRRRGANFDANAVEKAWTEALKQAPLN